MTHIKEFKNTHLNVDLKPFDWYGGKGHMADFILQYVPENLDLYCEPFGGGASLFFNMPPKKNEVYNDIDSRLVNFFRVLQNRSTMAELSHMLSYTLYSYEEYVRALDLLKKEESTSVEKAWAFFVVYNCSYVASGKSKGGWAVSKKVKSNKIKRFRKRIELLDIFCKRFLNVIIDHRDAIDCIKKFDTEGSFFYLDPPYPAETRTKNYVYKYETSQILHERLVQQMLTSKGMFILSCYWHDVYQPLIDFGYRMVDFKVVCYSGGMQGKKPSRKEVLLLSPNLKVRQLKMF